MRHWNRNQLCSIWISTTGLDPLVYEICEIAAIPLDVHLKPDRAQLPFHFSVRPTEPSIVDFVNSNLSRKGYAELLAKSMGADRVIELFEQWWMKKLKLGFNKYGNPYKIIPLVYDAQHVIPFLRRFFGEETYKYMFRGEVRDLLATATFMSDHQGYHTMPVLTGTGKCQHNFICNRYQSPSRLGRGALQKALSTAEAYRTLVKGGTFVH